MTQSTNLMDEEIRLLLMEDDQDLQTKGLDHLLKLHQMRICRFVQGVFPYFRESELVDVLYELCRSLKKMLDEKRVDLERPISPLFSRSPNVVPMTCTVGSRRPNATTRSI